MSKSTMAAKGNNGKKTIWKRFFPIAIQLLTPKIDRVLIRHALRKSLLILKI
jgi:hypothetical protein